LDVLQCFICVVPYGLCACGVRLDVLQRAESTRINEWIWKRCRDRERHEDD